MEYLNLKRISSTLFLFSAIFALLNEFIDSSADCAPVVVSHSPSPSQYVSQSKSKPNLPLTSTSTYSTFLSTSTSHVPTNSPSLALPIPIPSTSIPSTLKKERLGRSSNVGEWITPGGELKPMLTAVAMAPSRIDSIQYQREQLQNIILTNQRNLLRLIGLVDKSWESFGDSLRNTTFRFFLDGQKSFAKAYHATPQFVNRFIQRIGVLFGSAGDQLNQVFATYQTNLKSFVDNWEEHEHDFHHVFQRTFKDINANLGVPPLPDYNFQWT